MDRDSPSGSEYPVGGGLNWCWHRHQRMVAVCAWMRSKLRSAQLHRVVALKIAGYLGMSLNDFSRA